MNAIYNKLKPKRKYTRKPKCLNLAGLCTWEKCRCNYPLMQPETKAKIDEYLHHRQKVIKRKRDIELLKLDFENAIDEHNEKEANKIIGEFRRRRERQARYEKWCWRALWALCATLLILSLFI